ncbi:MAG: sigma-70 family RNA polymerase sigma factor [Myxococcales bacterium]|nr:sigma-70 family RNA polymerase sigma factor [Myxococcales bacterium]
MIPKQEKNDHQVLDPAAMEMIRSIARHIRWKHGREVPESDLISFGVVGYLESQRRHNANRVPLLAFAYRRVYGAMLDGVRHWSHKRRIAHAFYKKNRLLQLQGDAGGVESNWKYRTAFYSLKLGYLPCTGNESSVESSSRVSGEGIRDVYGNPEDIVDRCRRDTILHRVLSMLSQEDRILLQQSFFSDMTLQEIGKLNGVSRSWTCRRHQRALAALEALLHEHAPHFFEECRPEK